MSTVPDFDANEPIPDEEIIEAYNQEIQATLNEIAKLISDLGRLVQQRQQLLDQHGRDHNRGTVE